MIADTGHPPLLAWYVAGRLDAQRALEIDCHLQVCAACRAEAARLESMGRSLALQSRTDHVAAPDLVLYEEDPRLLTTRAAPIEAHLEGCAGCRDDLASLRGASARIGPLPPARSGRAAALAKRAAWAGAAAAAVLMVAAAVRLQVPEPGPARPAVFAPPLRGEHGVVLLEGSGPWAGLVLLPHDAGHGPHRLTVLRDNGTQVAGFERRLRPDADGVIRADLPALFPPGAYELRLEPDDPPGAPAIAYRFEVVTPGARPPAGVGPPRS